jgi:tetratricopeptide (TPR) repeat protein
MATGPHAPRRRRVLALAAASAAAVPGRAALAAMAGVIASASARAQVPAFSEEARRRLLPGDAAERERRVAERQGLLVDGERHLQAGRAAEAMSAFEAAALMLHAADTELGIVRSLMASGEYRRSLAFGAHTAGVHRDQPAGAALYVWLLRLGGQAQVARFYLDEALALAPGNALLLSVSSLLDEPWPRAAESLLQLPWRAAPYAWAEGALPPTSLAVVGTATLLGEGGTAVTDAALAKRGPDGKVWLRNGLGQTTAARIDASLPQGLVRLQLDPALAAPAWQQSEREPFAGSPGLMAEYAPDPDGSAAWPLLRQGFFAGQPGLAQARPLGLAPPPGPRGGPVFDRNGQLAGVAAGGMDGEPVRLVPLQALAAGIDLPRPDPAAQVAGLPDVVYEHALRAALQVLVPA